MNREARTVFDYAGLASATIAVADHVRTITECPHATRRDAMNEDWSTWRSAPS